MLNRMSVWGVGRAVGEAADGEPVDRVRVEDFFEHAVDVSVRTPGVQSPSEDSYHIQP